MVFGVISDMIGHTIGHQSDIDRTRSDTDRTVPDTDRTRALAVGICRTVRVCRNVSDCRMSDLSDCRIPVRSCQSDVRAVPCSCTVGLSDCRTVGLLSDRCRTAVGLLSVCCRSCCRTAAVGLVLSVCLLAVACRLVVDQMLAVSLSQSHCHFVLSLSLDDIFRKDRFDTKLLS